MDEESSPYRGHTVDNNAQTAAGASTSSKQSSEFAFNASLDTVRALHQTVVSLRSALDAARHEIERLKQQIYVQKIIEDGRDYRQLTATNSVNLQPNESSTDNVDVNESDSKSQHNPRCIKVVSDIFIKGNRCSKSNRSQRRHTQKGLNSPKHKNTFKRRRQRKLKTNDITTSIHKNTIGNLRNTETLNSENNSDEMASKINVKIRVSSNVDLTTEDQSSASSSNNQNNKASETTPCSMDNLQLDLGSVNSLSEGDNSVFGDLIPATNQHQLSDDENKLDTKSPKDNQSNQEQPDDQVDDIELIFSSTDSREIIHQEDLISISEYEPWQPSGTTGTPVLVRFASLPSDPSHSDRDTAQVDSPKINNSETADNIGSDTFQSTHLTKHDKAENLDETSETEGVQRDESFDTFAQDDISSSTGLKWTNYNVIIETDISKCGIGDELNLMDKGRRNTCPEPTFYRPIIGNRDGGRSQATRCPLAVKFSKSGWPNQMSNRPARPILGHMSKVVGASKRSSAAQTEISALPEHWRSESNLTGGHFGAGGFFTLPSKFIPRGPSYTKYPSRMSNKTQEARRILLSDINFTSMVPELSRSADHLCPENQENQTGEGCTGDCGAHHHAGIEQNRYGHSLGMQTSTMEPIMTQSGPYSCHRAGHLRTAGITPSVSLCSPSVSQWTVNENSMGTQTLNTTNTGTHGFCGTRGNSFESCRSYSLGSRYSSTLSRQHRSRSVPSVRCAICKQNHSLRTSESMHYTPSVAFQEITQRNVRGSLPDLRHDCSCPRRYGGPSLYKIPGDSSGSTDSLIDEAEDFLRRSIDGILLPAGSRTENTGYGKRVNRRCSETDIQKDFTPSKQALPFLPRSPTCLKLGHLAKVITPNGRIVIGRIKYIGPLAGYTNSNDEVFFGLQLPNNSGNSDGSIEGRKFFDCEPQRGVFVPFKKIIMAWTG